jgi:DNA-binding NtrC family response regulator
MPARVVVVHDEPELLTELVAAIRLAGHDVAAFVDPMKALDALDVAQRIEVLITRVQFPQGKPNGIALALMARTKRPGIRVVFTARPEFAQATEGLGTFTPAPINVAEVVITVGRLLAPDGEDTS